MKAIYRFGAHLRHWFWPQPVYTVRKFKGNSAKDRTFLSLDDARSFAFKLKMNNENYQLLKASPISVQRRIYSWFMFRTWVPFSQWLLKTFGSRA